MSATGNQQLVATRFWGLVAAGGASTAQMCVVTCTNLDKLTKKGIRKGTNTCYSMVVRDGPYHDLLLMV
jgi:hypothetical protein